jgi:hypothetical protein
VTGFTLLKNPCGEKAKVERTYDLMGARYLNMHPGVPSLGMAVPEVQTKVPARAFQLR